MTICNSAILNFLLSSKLYHIFIKLSTLRYVKSGIALKPMPLLLG